MLGTPDSGEYAGQTRFLDADAVSDAGFSKRISIGKWNDISHLVLMTDGVSDPWFETDNGLQNPQKWDRLMAELSPLLTDPEHASAQLVEWLNFSLREITMIAQSLCSGEINAIAGGYSWQI